MRARSVGSALLGASIIIDQLDDHVTAIVAAGELGRPAQGLRPTAQ
jgi:hypothetical protein